ncbi:MAG: hypothetical protein ACREOL_08215 [Candidatus Dormibacteria bacterium]
MRAPHGVQGEIVGQVAAHVTRAQVTAALLATAPVAVRLGWWWWKRGAGPRTEPLDVRPPPTSTLEHTEVELVRRSLGRWRVRVVNTRWQLSATTVVSPPRPRQRPVWLTPLWRLAASALEGEMRRGLPVDRHRPPLIPPSE